jgi:dihydroflavonol-4-reductase
MVDFRSRACLVTGGTGFLGLNLVQELVRQGWQVTLLVRPAARLNYVAKWPIRLVQGDILKPASLDAAMAGQDTIFHLAGDTSWWRRHRTRQWAMNTNGVTNVAAVALRHGVRRMVHTSTVDALGYNPAGIADEAWSDFNFGPTYHYAYSKREGERIALEWNVRGLEVVCLNPGAMLGPFDVTLQYGRLFAELRDGRIPAVPVGGLSVNHVAEVARAHVAAATYGRPGERYICAGHNITYRVLFAGMANAAGAQVPRLDFPPPLLSAYGWLLQGLSELTGRPPQVDPGMAHYLNCRAWYSSTKAERELSYRIRPLEDAIADALADLQLRGIF